MAGVKELTWKQLRPDISADDLPCRTTAEIEPLSGIIGQERAVEALNFGLSVRMKGYNIYVAGLSGSGKTSYAKKRALETAANEPAPPDWCYVCNFKDENHPIALSFPPGGGRLFRKDMEKLVEDLKTDLRKAFMSEEYASKKGVISRDIDERKSTLLDRLNRIGAAFSLAAKLTDQEIQILPMVDGKMLSPEEYDQLSEEQVEQIEKNSVTFSGKAQGTLRELDDLEREEGDRLDELDLATARAAMKRHVTKMKKKYADAEKVCTFIDAMADDMIDNMDDLLGGDDDSSTNQIAALLLAQQGRSDLSLRYRVNLIVDHSEDKCAPVVVSFSPTAQDLSGEIELTPGPGGTVQGADFMSIRAGQLHQANGGYLIIQAYDVLSSEDSWEILRRVMKTGEICVGGGSQAGQQVLPFLKAESIPADLKIIMVGNGFYYDLLTSTDEDFSKFFKIRADFDSEMPRTKQNERKVAAFIRSFCEREKTPPFTAEAAAMVLEYSARSVERQDRLSTRFNLIADILCEAAAWAKMDGAGLITDEYVRKAIEKKEDRLRLGQEKLAEAYDEDVIMIATEGAEIGQINALAVLDSGDYAFGIPSRITATTYVGRSGIVNIEKEAEMSGQTHNKGVQIISGYLGQTYAQDFPLSLSCRICFEQSYSGIDGDSASSTELYAILSSLSRLPIRQDLAVTGSVNQRGQIQAIGGANYKIEGFFDLCRRRGLTGTQGVLIPESNVRNLVLRDDVVQAVRSGKFHIYPIRTIDEGIALLTGCPAGAIDPATGAYPEDSVHGRVLARLKAMSEAAAKLPG